MDSWKKTIVLISYVCAMLALCAMFISPTTAAEYKSYDGPFFTVEYPNTWAVEENLTSFTFSDKGNVHRIIITIHKTYPQLTISNDYTTMVNSTLDEGTMHFIKTLMFKSYVLSPKGNTS